MSKPYPILVDFNFISKPTAYRLLFGIEETEPGFNDRLGHFTYRDLVKQLEKDGDMDRFIVEISRNCKHAIKAAMEENCLDLIPEDRRIEFIAECYSREGHEVESIRDKVLELSKAKKVIVLNEDI